MLEETFGCLEDVSGCSEDASRWSEEASGYVHLPAPKTTNRTLENLLNLILNTPFEWNLGKSSPNKARNNSITNKRIKTQWIKDLTQIKILISLTVACVYAYKCNMISILSLTGLEIMDY